MKRFLSLEELVGADRKVETPRPASVSDLSESSDQSRIALSALRSDQQALVSLEAMGHALRTLPPKQIGRFGVLFANIAIGTICSSNRISLESLTVNAVDYDQDPDKAMADGVASLEKTKQDLLDRTHNNLTDLLVILCRRRDWINKQIGLLWRHVTALDVYLEQNEGGFGDDDLRAIQGVDWLAYLDQGGNGMAVDTPRVMADLGHFLTEHTHLYKRIIAKQINWLNDHKDNVLKGPNGFRDFSFSHVEYVCHGATPIYPPSEAALKELPVYDWVRGLYGKKVVSVNRSQQLPGAYAFYTFTPAWTALKGEEAVEAIVDSMSGITFFESALRNRIMEEQDPPIGNLRRLPVVECKARLAEIKRGLRDFEHWADMAYCKMWKEAYFEEEVIASMLKTSVDTTTERSLTKLTQGVLQQLVEAGSREVAEYALNVIGTLIQYVGASVNQEVDLGLTLDLKL